MRKKGWRKKGNTWIGKILIIMLMSRCAGPKDVEGKGWPSTSEYLLSSLRWGWLHGGVWGWGWTFAYFYQYLASCACAPSSIPSDEPSRSTRRNSWIKGESRTRLAGGRNEDGSRKKGKERKRKKKSVEWCVSHGTVHAWPFLMNVCIVRA